MTETSADIGELAKALAKAQAAIRSASKDSVNPHFNRSYADLASVWEACRAPLTDNGLSVVQQPIADEKRAGVVTTLLHGSGQWMRSTLWITPERPGPQPLGSALTYARRYSLAAIAGVAPDDDDGNAAQNGNAAPGPKPPVAGNAAKANTVKASNNDRMATAGQVQQIHILKEKIGGWTGKADHDKHPYRAALLAYKDSKGAPVTTSKDLTFEQAVNLIKRMDGMVDRQTETARKMEAESPLGRQPGEDDGEEPDAGLMEKVREAARERWGKATETEGPTWLFQHFGVKSTGALTQLQASKALQLLLTEGMSP